MFYAGFPLCLTASYLVMFIAGGASEVRYQISNRLRKARFYDAMLFYRAAQLSALVIGIVVTFLFTVGAIFVSRFIFGIRNSYLALYYLSPAILLGSFIGNMRGILEAVGLKKLSRLSVYLMTILTALFSILFSALGASRGVQIGALLRNAGYEAVYTAGGFCAGLSAAVFVTFLFLLVVSHFAVKSIRERVDDLGIDNDEQFRELFRYYLYRLSPYAVVGFVPAILLIIDYRIYTTSIEDFSATMYLAEWGGFMGITFPFILIVCIVIAMLFTGDIAIMANNYIREKYRKMSIRFSMVMRLAGYLAIGLTFYVFGAAKPFVQIFHGGLFGGATDGAVLSLKYGAPLVFLATMMFVVGMVFWMSYNQNLVMVSFIFGAAVQTGAMYILLHVTDLGMSAVPISLDVFGLGFLGAAYFLGRRELFARHDPSWLIDDAMCVFCALIAMAPVIMLNDYMTTEVTAFFGVLFLLALYVVVYVVLSIFLNCVDLGNIERIPGGALILRLAAAFGRV